MSDLISRSGMVDSLTKYRIEKMLEGKNVSLVWECIDKVLQQPSIDAVPQWIPCSERLPEESGRYLVTRGLNACGSLWNRSYIANYSDLMGIKSKRIWWQGNVGKSDFERLDDVLAWMPLPKPYKEERREE